MADGLEGLKHARGSERETHEKLDEGPGAERQGQALAQCLHDPLEFKQCTMSVVKKAHTQIYTVLSESSSAFLIAHLDLIAEVIFQRMEEELGLHATVLCGVNLANPTPTTMDFLQGMKKYEDRMAKFKPRFTIQIGNGEAQLEFSVYDNSQVLIFPSATRTMALFFDNSLISTSFAHYFVDTLAHRSRQLYSIDEAIAIGRGLGKPVTSPEDQRPSR
jgi:hypothetical protein